MLTEMRQPFASSNQVSVMKRRGKSISNLMINDNSNDRQELCTPKIIDQLLAFVVTPTGLNNNSPKFEFSSCRYDGNKTPQEMLACGSTPAEFNSCALVTPLSLEKTDFTDYLTDISLHDIVGSSLHSKVSDEFLSNLFKEGSSTKITLFTPRDKKGFFSDNFLENLDLKESDVTLLAPKTKDLITPQTPVVLKRTQDGQNEFNIYFPPEYTYDLVNTFQQCERNVSMFPFPPNKNDIDQMKNCQENQVDFNNESINEKEISKIKDSLSKAFSAPSPIHIFNTSEKQQLKQKSSLSKLKKSVSDGGVQTKAFHNKLERKRREEQLMRFQGLKQCIPGLMFKRKSSKIAILNAAKSYIQELQNHNVMLQQVRMSELNKKQVLLHKLQTLKYQTLLPGKFA